MYAIPLDILKMKPKDRWNWVYRGLAEQRTVDVYRYWIVQCMRALGFEYVYWIIDEYGMRFDIYGERFLYVKRHKTGKHGYIVSRFGVERVSDIDD